MSGTPAPTVLAVDDEPALLGLVTTVLGRSGYRVLPAESAAAALAVWKERGPSIDLLLTDIVMPGGLSGAELADQLAADRPSLKVLFMTGHARGPLLGDDFLRRNRDRLLLKPFTIQALLDAVQARLAAPD